MKTTSEPIKTDPPAPSMERRHFMQALAVAAGAGLGSGGGAAPLSAAGKGAAFRGQVLTRVEPYARAEHATCLLPGGLILVIGGLGQFGALASCQIYDTRDDSWYDAAPLSRARGLHTATSINGRDVLVLGGYNYGALSMASLYDPIRDKWEPAAPLKQPRYRHNAQTLPDGRIILTGGYHIGLIAQPEIYQL